VHKISIISRGMALGYTMSLPENDRLLVSKAKFESDMAAMLAGRVAEELVFDDITNGAVDDLDKVTKMARAMVTQYGMSDSMGPMIFGQRHEMVFLGRDIGEQRNYSEQVARQIDKEVRRIVSSAYEQARDLLTRFGDLHHTIARRLIQVETIDAEEFESFFQGLPGVPPRKVEPPTPSAPAQTSRPAGTTLESGRSSGTPHNPAPAPI
jgi:cell division protease FtsH